MSHCSEPSPIDFTLQILSALTSSTFPRNRNEGVGRDSGGISIHSGFKSHGPHYKPQAYPLEAPQVSRGRSSISIRGILMEDASSDNLASPCGLYCGECLYYEKECRGCVPSGGQPSWGKCPIYACTVDKDVEHCGECAEFPCGRFLKQYSRQLGPWRVFYKAGQLVYRKKIGTEAWVRQKASGRNYDPKVAVERYLAWEKTQRKPLKTKRPS